MRLRILVTVSALLAADFVCAEEPWRFITLADWHWAESYVWQEKFPDRYQQTLEKHTAEVATIKKLFGGDLMMLPGDSNTGHWDEPKFIQNFMPGATPEQSVLKAGNLCYSGMIKAFHDGGYSRLLMAVGDHEMGDNPWPSGSAVSRCQPQFKEAFAKAWNTDPDGGDFIYSAPIGKAPPRPLGTLYEGTSFAYRYKNVLFITVDVFHQESPSKVIGEEGTVTGAVTGEHLAWLDQILSEARKDPSICHIFVQGHLPVIYPVRKVSSSGMLMDHGTESDFWNVLRKYQVDIYFAGEVHDNTVTKDPDSDLLQVVSRGNFFDNIMTVNVTDRQIELTSYNQTGADGTDGQYTPYGHLLVDKSGDQTKIDGTGVLALLQPDARLLYFPMEKEEPLTLDSVTGLSERKDSDLTIRGKRCTQFIPNMGEFGSQYGALAAGIQWVDGPHGKAARFDRDSRMAVWAMGPPLGGRALSYALWIRTVSADNQLLVNTASIWSPNVRDFFNLDLNDGIPEIRISDKQVLAARSGKLNDGKWHHIAAVIPHDDSRLSDVQIYVDGKAVDTVQKSGADGKVFMNQAVRISLGGLGYSKKNFEALPVNPFDGEMDEVSIWARGIRPEEVKALAR